MNTTNWASERDSTINAMAVGEPKLQEFAKANAAAVAGTIDGRGPDSFKPDPDAGARMVCNISSVHVPLFVAASLRACLKRLMPERGD